MIRFAHPEMLWFLTLLPLLLPLVWLGIHRKAVFLRRLSRSNLLQQTPARFPALRREWVGLLLLLLPFLGIIVALADPRLPSGTPHIRGGVLDVVMLIDVSKSMAAEDYRSQSRLAKTSEIVRALLPTLQGNRIGLITFAGTSFRQAELTEDIVALDFILKHWVDTDTIGVGGSNIAAAMETGIALFPEDTAREQLMLLFSDGGESMENFETVLARAAHRGIRIVTLGLGTTQPSRIPLYDANRRFTGYIKAHGQVLTTRLNEEPLQRIATATHGTYMRVGQRDAWSDLLTQRSVVGDVLTRDEQKVFQPFLLVGLLALCGHKFTTRL